MRNKLRTDRIRTKTRKKLRTGKLTAKTWNELRAGRLKTRRRNKLRDRSNPDLVGYCTCKLSLNILNSDMVFQINFTNFSR